MTAAGCSSALTLLLVAALHLAPRGPRAAPRLEHLAHSPPVPSVPAPAASLGCGLFSGSLCRLRCGLLRQRLALAAPQLLPIQLCLGSVVRLPPRPSSSSSSSCAGDGEGDRAACDRRARRCSSGRCLPVRLAYAVKEVPHLADDFFIGHPACGAAP